MLTDFLMEEHAMRAIRTSVRIKPEIHARIQKIAHRKNLDLSKTINGLLKMALPRPLKKPEASHERPSANPMI
jgi:hypothetical protein